MGQVVYFLKSCRLIWLVFGQIMALLAVVKIALAATLLQQQGEEVAGLKAEVQTLRQQVAVLSQNNTGLAVTVAAAPWERPYRSPEPLRTAG